MDYLQILADHVEENGEVTKTLYPEDCPELLKYNGKNISEALTGQYDYSRIKPLPLTEGKAPGSAWSPPKGGWSESDSEYWEGIDTYGHHWCMLEDLFKMDFQRKVIDVRRSKLWGSDKDYTAAYNEQLINNKAITIEEFIGEDFLNKMRKLQEEGYNRITVRLK